MENLGVTNDEKFNIICLSNQQWDFPLPTNKKHVMSRLAKLGHNVLFVDPPINMGRLLIRQVFSGKWGIRRLLFQNYRSDDVRVYSPLNFIPKSGVLTKSFVKKINRLSKFGFDDSLKTIFWVYHIQIPDLDMYISNVKHDLLVYDCVDNYSAFPENSTIFSAIAPKEVVIEQEKDLAKRADIVFATAPGLVEKLKGYRDIVYYTPNVGDYEKFKDAPNMESNIPADLEKIPQPRIAFTGAIDEYKFDKDLVRKISRDFPKYSFVVIGPMALKDREASAGELGFGECENVHFMGSRPYEDIQNYFAGFDVYMIPFRLNDYTVGGCFPVKFHDALAAGLPIIVTNLPAYAPFKDVCYISETYDKFSKNIRLALDENSAEKVNERQTVAKENSWDGKVELMLKHIFDTLYKNK